MTKARLLALHLIAEHSKGRSWRTIAREDYGNQVHFATLNRIALSGGEWLPKDRQVLTALGLRRKRRERTWMQIKICEMAEETKEQVLKKWKKM